MDRPIASPQWVPKVHPATRQVEPEDPMELHATLVPGDPEVMLRCVVEEYARLGWNAEQILRLFQNPFYPALDGLLQCYGEDGIRERISGVLRQVGVFRLQAKMNEEPCAAKSEPDVVEIQIPGHLKSKDREQSIVAARTAASRQTGLPPGGN